jgi:hypothetical protein
MPSASPDVAPALEPAAGIAGASVLDAVARIVALGGSERRREIVGWLRHRFEERTGAFAPEDPWFEERSRAFWSDAVTRGRFGREVAAELGPDERAWLGALDRSHRGLFRVEATAAGRKLVDVWSGAELVPTVIAFESAAELDASAGQLFDARVVGSLEPYTLALLPGAVFHPRPASAAIEPVLAAARARDLSTDEALDALLRMERSLRALSRVKATYAYRVEALAPPDAHAAAPLAVRRASKSPR